MNEQQVKLACRKNLTRYIALGIGGFILANALSEAIVGTGLSALITFILAFSLAAHYFQSVLIDVVKSESSDN